MLNLASFLGNQLRNLHLLPVPSYDARTCDNQNSSSEMPSTNIFVEALDVKHRVPSSWQLFIETLNRRKKDVSTHLANWYASVTCKNNYLVLVVVPI